MRAIDVVLIEIVLLMLMFIWPSSDKVTSVDKCSKKIEKNLLFPGHQGLYY